MRSTIESLKLAVRSVRVSAREEAWLKLIVTLEMVATVVSVRLLDGNAYSSAPEEPLLYL